MALLLRFLRETIDEGLQAGLHPEQVARTILQSMHNEQERKELLQATEEMLVQAAEKNLNYEQKIYVYLN